MSDMSSQLKAVLKSRVERLGYLGAFFAFAARQPMSLYHFFRYTEELKVAVPADFIDVVALTVSTAFGNDYERVQHERLAARRGRNRSWVAAAAAGATAHAGILTVEEEAVQALAASVVADAGHRSEEELRTLTNQVGPDVAIGVLLAIGRYVGHSHISNVLRLTNPVP